MERYLSVLYTKHLTQKRKVWNDGRLSVSGGAVRLFDDNNLPLGEIGGYHEGAKLFQSEKYLIEVCGPYQEPSNAPLSVPEATGPSKGMQKLLKSKYKAPAKKRPPPPPQEKPTKRLLQPFELQRHYYGNQGRVSASISPPTGACPPQHQNLPPHGVRDGRSSYSHQPPQVPTHPSNYHEQKDVDPVALHSSNSLPPTFGVPPSADNRSALAPPPLPTSMAPTMESTAPPKNMSALPPQYPPEGSSPTRNPHTATAASKPSLFAGNNFDPGSFYGEEEEEEKTEDTSSWSVPAQPQEAPPQDSSSVGLLELFGLAPMHDAASMKALTRGASFSAQPTNPPTLEDHPRSDHATAAADRDEFSLPANDCPSSDED